MKKYYDKYRQQLEENQELFIKDENKYFKEGITEEEKVKEEYMLLLKYYIDSGTNEITYLSNQREVIESTLKKIKFAIARKEYTLSQYYIVSLQLVLDIEIRFRGILANMILLNLSIKSFVNVDEYDKKINQETYESVEKSVLLKFREELIMGANQMEDDMGKGEIKK